VSALKSASVTADALSKPALGERRTTPPTFTGAHHAHQLGQAKEKAMDLHEAAAEIARLRAVVAQAELDLARSRRELVEAQRELVEERECHRAVWRSDLVRVCLAADVRLLDLLTAEHRLG
jgi:hypothetical protein